MTCCYYTIIYDEHVMSKQKTKIENNKGGNWSAKTKNTHFLVYCSQKTHRDLPFTFQSYLQAT